MNKIVINCDLIVINSVRGDWMYIVKVPNVYIRCYLYAVDINKMYK